MDSILNSIKKLLGIDAQDTSFDDDIIMHINTYLMALTELGVGDPDGFEITGPNEEWSNFLPAGQKLASVKTYIYLKVKLVFDPPLSSAVIEAMNRQASELEFRISVVVDPGPQTT